MKPAYRYICLFVLLLLYSVIAFTQNQWIDSAKKYLVTQKEDTNKVWILKTMADYYSFNDPDSGIMYAKQALTLSEKLQFDRGIFWSIVSLDHSLYITGNYTLELDYALKAIPFAKKLNDRYASGWSNGMLADSYLSLGDYNTAMIYVRSILKNIEQFYPDDVPMQVTLSLLGQFERHDGRLGQKPLHVDIGIVRQEP